jgi:predicted DNA-binding protein with PD1-like motif
MEYQRFENTLLVRLDRGEEIVDSMRRLAAAEDIRLAHVSALGAVDDFTVGVYDVGTWKYHPLSFTGQHEITSLFGTINTMDGAFYCHIHMTAGNITGAVVGGHLNRAVISATAELVVTVTDGTVDRVKDEAVTGLNLFSFEDGVKL